MLAGSDPDATVTAGNSSGQNDAAAVAIVTTPQRAERLGLRPLARLVSWSLAGCGAEPDGDRARPRGRPARWSGPG